MPETINDFASSNVRELKYEPSGSTLQIEFLNGSTYQYFDFPENLWEQFKNASSKGEFIHQNIRGQFRYARV